MNTLLWLRLETVRHFVLLGLRVVLIFSVPVTSLNSCRAEVGRCGYVEARAFGVRMGLPRPRGLGADALRGDFGTELMDAQ